MSDITKNENYIDIKERFKKSNKYMLTIDYTDIKFLFYYIDEQQKEIEELKEENIELINQRTEGFLENDRLKKEIEELKKVIKMVEIYKSNGIPEDAEMVIMRKDDFLRNTNNEFISKDKIREKIQELKTKTIGSHTGIYSVQIDILEELLEE